MRSGHHEVARAYVLYRERRTQERASQVPEPQAAVSDIQVLENGEKRPLDRARLLALITSACAGLGNDVRPDPIVNETVRNLYDGIPLAEVYKAAILSARTLIEKDPDYTYATARLLLHTVCREVLGQDFSQDEMAQAYVNYFPGFIQKGIAAGLLDPRLGQYDLEKNGASAVG